MKKIIYFDLDGTIVDFQSAFEFLEPEVLSKYQGRLDEVPNIFSLMKPIAGAIEVFNQLAQDYDCYILSTAPWENASAWSDKLLWVKEHLGENGYKRLILSHHKHLNIGDYLIDDRLKNGAERFTGKHIQFGTDLFSDWQAVLEYFNKEKLS